MSMLSSKTPNPEISTFKELENLLSSQDVDLTSAGLDPDGWFRVTVKGRRMRRTHHGNARTLSAAITAAFDALARGVDVVAR